MKNITLLVLLTIAFISCKKEETNPKITFSLISKDATKQKRIELYVGENFTFNEPFYGSKEISLKANKKEYDVYMVYYFEGKSTDTLRVKGLNTDTSIAMVAMKSYSFKIK